MNFGPNHYVPILKVKRGEKNALRAIEPPFHAGITPLLEVVEIKKDKTLKKHLGTAFHGLKEALYPYARCFLDARELSPCGPEASDAVFQCACQRGIRFTPVTGLSRGPHVSVATKYDQNGVAIRVMRRELEDGGLQQRVTDFMRDNALGFENTDLIVDVGVVDDLIPYGVARLAEVFLADIPDIGAWRTLTLSGCAFPLSMRAVERDSFELFERSEWLGWQHLHARRDRLARLPTFSDCAIQRPEGVEEFDFRFMEVSAAIRYAVMEQWVLVKGQSTRSMPGGVQFPELATRLVYGHLRTSYRGADHCEGCRKTKEAADGALGFGSAEVWRRWGTVHHIATVMEQLRGLPWP